MLLSEITAWALGHLSQWAAQPLTPQDIVADAAGTIGVALVAASALVKTMIPLRWLAVGGNLGFLVFGLLHPSVITLAVAAVLLPINLYRVREMTRLVHKINAAGVASKLSGLWLRPYMKPRKLRAGKALFHKGDKAHQLFLLAEGELQLVEIGRAIEPGRIFGEIALFSPGKRRTSTARCVSDCTVLTIDEATVRQLYFEHPAFGFHLIELVVARLSDDVGRADARRSTLGDSQQPPHH